MTLASFISGDEEISAWKIASIILVSIAVYLWGILQAKWEAWWKPETPPPVTEYIIQGKIVQNVNFFDHSVIFPHEYRAIMFKVHQSGIDIKKAKRVGNSQNAVRTGDKLPNSIFMHTINTDTPLSLTPEITLQQKNLSQVADDQKSAIETYNLVLTSKTLSFNELKQTVDLWTREYHQFLKEYNDGKLYIFSYLGKSQEEKDKKLQFESSVFDSSRDFSNIFFEQKDQVMGRIDHFINEKERYRRKGIPYTLGFLFHGSPGCGKTSTIKAIANRFQRHILEIHLSRVKTCRELKEIFCSELINETYVPANRKIIVLEDIDCMGDVVLEREEEMGKKEQVSTSDRYGPFSPGQGDMMTKLFEKDDKLTLSYILNLIDGLNEQNGRVIVMTTNHPEKLDGALIRPGRVDMRVHFQRCSATITKEILEFYFEEPLPEEAYVTLPDYRWSPAEVFQFCQNTESMEGSIELILQSDNKN